ncbi:MAG: S8 family serine peptidase [Clostridia bacterium]|nr:S8 family serine peptidase [Clostridia bacterium]
MKIYRKLLAIVLCVVLCLSIAPAYAQTTKGGAAQDTAARIEELLDFSSRLNSMTARYEPAGTKDPDDPYANARIIVKSADELDYAGALAAVNGYNDLHIIQYATAEEAEAACKKYAGMAGVEYATPDVVMTITAEPGSDDFLSWGYGVNHVDAFTYNEWIIDTVGLANLPEVIVAVIDTGVDSDHPFIMDRLVPGYDFVNNDSNPEDDHYHGTHVSGTIVDGTLENVKVMGLKGLNAAGSGSSSTIALAMEYAYLNGADVVNMSLRGPGYSTLYEETIAEGAEYGTVFCVASGNDGGNAEDYCPGNVVQAITVAAIDSSYGMAYFSNTGDVVDISAPGVDINSAYMGGGYVLLDGTSMATPHTAAVAAMIKSYDITYSVDAVTDVIKASARPATFTGGGAGMLWAADMLTYGSLLNTGDTALVFRGEGNYPWVVERDSVRSGNAGVNNSVSTLVGRGVLSSYQTITFDYRVSSQSNGDYLRFYIDDELMLEVSGECAWTEFSCVVGGSGEHEFRWEFSKNASGASGSDCAWIKNVAVDMTLSSYLNTGNGNFAFESDGTYPWYIDNGIATSGNAGVNSSVSTLTTTAELVAGVDIAFDYQVSSQAGDVFTVTMNGETLLESGATNGWQHFEYTIEQTGVYELEFSYTKDARGSSGSDWAQLRNVDLLFSLDYALNVAGGNLEFTTSALPWIVYQDYAMSGNAGVSSSSSYVTLTVNLNAGDTLTFDYSVSSESNWDFFIFTVNNAEVIKQSGIVAWTTYTYTAATSGSYVFRWNYTKDGSVNSGSDAAYLDDVFITGDGLVGDINGDGDVGSDDALMALRASAGLITLDADQIARGDVNGDGSIGTDDALLIMRYALGLIDTL